ncbi:Fic family protein [Streptosporangium sp. OZ121]|uniref:Fic family protein n=1 Tax=Streptosporangium sp. OZ121 TaxID=3444183 RepID=UPI003F7945A7
MGSILYGTPLLEAVDEAVLGEIEEMRRDLKHRLAETHRWDGRLRRQLQARAIQGSNSIEGHRASVEDIESIMAGEEPLDASAAVAREISGYQQALTYIQLLSRAPVFAFDAGLLHALNFMMIGHHHDRTPGTVRPGGIYVRNSATGEVVYEGPDAEGQGRNTYDYYDALAGMQRRGWSPHGDTLHWVRFCLRAHHLQAQRVGRRLSEAGEVWMLLEERVDADGLDTRTVSALYEVFVNRRLRRSRYQLDESLSQGQAARDLRDLAARGWLTPYGETKGRFYAPGERMRAIKEDLAQRVVPLRDPYR